MPPDAERSREHNITMHDASDVSNGEAEGISRVPFKRKKGRGDQQNLTPSRTKSAPTQQRPSPGSRPQTNRSKSGDGLQSNPRFPKNTPRGGARFPRNSPRMAPSPSDSSKDPKKLNKPKEYIPNKPKEAVAKRPKESIPNKAYNSYTGLLEKIFDEEEKREMQKSTSRLNNSTLDSSQTVQTNTPSDESPPKRLNSAPTRQKSNTPPDESPPKRLNSAPTRQKFHTPSGESPTERHDAAPTRQKSKRHLSSSSGNLRRSPERGERDRSKEQNQSPSQEQAPAAVRRPSMVSRSQSENTDAAIKNRAASLLNHSLMSNSQSLMYETMSMDQSTTSRMQRRLSASTSGGDLANMLSQQRARSASDDGISVAQTEVGREGGRMPRRSSTRGTRGSRSKSRQRRGSGRKETETNAEESPGTQPSPRTKPHRGGGRLEKDSNEGEVPAPDDGEPSTRRMQHRSSTTTSHRTRSRSRPRTGDNSSRSNLSQSTGENHKHLGEGETEPLRGLIRRTSSSKLSEQNLRARSRTRQRAMSDNSKTGSKPMKEGSNTDLDSSIQLSDLKNALQKHNDDNKYTKRRSSSTSPMRNNSSSNNNSRNFRDRSRSPRNSPTRSNPQTRRGRQSPSRRSPSRPRERSKSRPRDRSKSPPAPAIQSKQPGVAPPSGGGPSQRAGLTLESVFGREVTPKTAFDALTTITGISEGSNESSVGEQVNAASEVLQFDPTNVGSVTSFVRPEKDGGQSGTDGGVFKMESLSESRHGEHRGNHGYLPVNMDMSNRGNRGTRSRSRSRSRAQRRPSASSHRGDDVGRKQRRASLTLENVFGMEDNSAVDHDMDSQSTMTREVGNGSMQGKRIRRRDRERNRLRSRDQQLDEKINSALLMDREQSLYLPQDMAAKASSETPDSPLLGGEGDMDTSLDLGDSLASEASFADADEESGNRKPHRKMSMGAMTYLKQLRRSSFITKGQDSSTADGASLDTSASSLNGSSDSSKESADKKESTSIKKKVKSLLRGKSKRHLKMLGQEASDSDDE